MSKYQITDENTLSTLDAQLKDNLYIGGQNPSNEDALVFEQFKSEPSQDKYPNLWAWFALLSIYTPNIRDSWKQAAPQGKGTQGGKADSKTTEKPAKKEEAPAEEDDLFGEETEEEKAAAKALKDKKEAEKKDKKGGKPAIVQKSLILIDVKVWDPEQDYDALARKILAIQRPGLVWKTEYKLEEVAFGVKKIRIGCVVEDELVSIDDVNEEIESWEDEVQSVDIAAFNKL
jgi:elongation factor 1-beta